MKKNLMHQDDRVLARTNEILHRAAKVVQQEAKPGKKKAPKKKSQVVKKIPKKVGKILNEPRDRGTNVLVDGSPLSLYLKSLARPFDVYDVFCPISYNPSPSFIQTRARTTFTNLSVGVTAGTTCQLCLFPGHLAQVGDLSAAVVTAGGTMQSMDPTANHCQPINIGGTIYSAGPVTTNVPPSGNISPIAGTFRTGLAPGTAAYTTNGAGVNVPCTWDNVLPYTASSVFGHSRWQLVSMGIRVNNITNDLYRGGTVVSVQPNLTYGFADGDQQSTFERFPTFHDWGKCEGFELSWIPRTDDLAFWHTVDTPTVSTPRTTNLGAAMLVWLNAPADYGQTYSIETVFNWQMAGTYLNSVGGPAPHHPGLKPIIEQTISSLVNSSPSANQAVQIGRQALRATGNSLSQIVPAALGAVTALAKSGFS